MIFHLMSRRTTRTLGSRIDRWQHTHKTGEQPPFIVMRPVGKGTPMERLVEPAKWETT